MQNRDKLGTHVYNVPDEIDKKVAYLRLQAEGVKIDELTKEQQKYLASWDTNL
ncbi:MAG: adenosylhomocysteinase [Syntrophomonadaceae bacterium]|nr:adenosylhomocysteinase [Syntrophomonadaceae bacterium]